MKLVLLFLTLFIVSILIGRKWTNFQFNQEIKQLFSETKVISANFFTHSQLEGLPEPVQRYFKHVLKEGQPYISYVRLKHDGRFKTDLKKDWVDITGEQYFTAAKPGFIWIGKTNLFIARDMFLADKGGLKVKLFSLIKVAGGTGPHYDQGELLRWLGESAWFPTNLLPSKNLSWLPIDDQTAQLIYTYNQQTVSFKVSFNANGEITQMETKRYMGEDNLENWLGKFSDYQEINEILIPTQAEGLWRLKSGDQSYAQFQVRTIEYNKPELF